jgi:sugar O-acyltransferase (sialic acid O-acetyltransferase NeuD family)
VKKLVILGAGGYAQEVLWVVDDINERFPEFEFKGFVDPKAPQRKGQQLYGRPVIGGFETARDLPGDIYFCCGIGDPRSRMKECLAAEALGWKPVTLIHPSVIVAKFCRIGEGTVIGAGSILAPHATVGRHCAINNHAGVGHDSVLGDYVVLSPGSRISGNAKIEDLVLIGTNAVVYVGRTMGRGSLLGANSFLVTNLAAGRSAVGNPAKPFTSKVGGGICTHREPDQSELPTG